MGSALLADPHTARVVHAAWSGDAAVLVPSPPGSGKTRLVVLLAAMLAHRAGLRVGIAAQTREQAVQIARRLGEVTDRSGLVWSTRSPRPEDVRVVAGAATAFPADGGAVRVATTARWLFLRAHEFHCDVLIVDEAWQCTYADLGALGAFSDQVVCVGDPGQIAPVVTGRTRRWRDSPTGPHLPAPEAVGAALGADAASLALPSTWRLGPTTTALVQPAFYPDLPFGSRRPPEQVVFDGVVVEEVVAHVVSASSPCDPALIAAGAQRVRHLLGADFHTGTGRRAVTDRDVAVVCSHVNQAAALRAHLNDLDGLLVGTANQLQGLERRLVVALHPLAGYRDLSAFSLDLGRACVMLSRHRAHLCLVTDGATRALLDRAVDAGLPGAVEHRRILDDLGVD